MKKSLFISVTVLLSTVHILFASTQPEFNIEVEIDWIQEMNKGGKIGVALLCLSFIACLFALERLFNLRRDKFGPSGFTDKVIPLFKEGKFSDILLHCRNTPSTLARMCQYIVEHRNAKTDRLELGATDIGTREMKLQMQRAYPLAVVATMSPLLGLLGTIVGMIEAFAKVAIVGDTSDSAALLADSIGKALITTAAGLVIAIPALGAYHWFKFRTSFFSTQLEEGLELMINEWFVEKEPSDESVSPA